jgi:hypothetical protein
MTYTPHLNTYLIGNLGIGMLLSGCNMPRPARRAIPFTILPAWLVDLLPLVCLYSSSGKDRS